MARRDSIGRARERLVDKMPETVSFSYLQDPSKWVFPESLKISGAEIIWFERYDDQLKIAAIAKGKAFVQVMALLRLSQDLS